MRTGSESDFSPAEPSAPSLQEFLRRDPGLREVLAGRPTLWINPGKLPFAQADPLCRDTVSDGDIADARARFERFAPLLALLFPEARRTQGHIRSALEPIPRMQYQLGKQIGNQTGPVPGRLLLKQDSHLPIAGSVKARGGIYEVLKHAEDLALESGLYRPGDSTVRLADPDLRAVFASHTIQVGSTGNLGLSIGISGTALGFRVKVHMSADARQWKKDLLRTKGAEVVEYTEDYSAAVAEGRRLSASDPTSYFIDDEHSKTLFLGYAAAAAELQEQLEERKIPVDPEHPLLVWIPAGVGGAPGGISYGLKRIFRDDVFCFFAEPASCPSVLLGMATGLHERADVRDFGLSGVTAADGLACPRPSGLVTRLLSPLVSGVCTVEDDALPRYTFCMTCAEEIRLEPSACAGFAGPLSLLPNRDALAGAGLDPDRLSRCTQVVWATGGGLLPDREFWKFREALF